jgi:uncharacterized phage infection (PIP) family protein YhgE
MPKHNDESAREMCEELRRIRHEIQELKDSIMSAISDFATAQTAFQDRMDTAVAGLQGDVKNLTDQISALQASTGTITPADQALLDGIQARASTITDKLAALDALTPPVLPPVPAP